MDEKWILVILLWAVLIGTITVLWIKESMKSPETRKAEADAMREKWKKNREEEREKWKQERARNKQHGCAGGVVTAMLCFWTFVVIVFLIIFLVGMSS